MYMILNGKGSFNKLWSTWVVRVSFRNLLRGVGGDEGLDRRGGHGTVCYI